MKRRVLSAVIALSMSASACAIPKPPPETPDDEEYSYTFEAKKNGEPLKVEGHSFVYTTQERVELGETQTYNDKGQYTGTQKVYGNQTRLNQGYEWDVFQGRNKIDVLSALHIARDEAFEKAFNKRIDQINENHENAMSVYEKGIKDNAATRKTGIIVGATGGIVAGGWAILASATSDFGKDPNPPIPRPLSYGVIIGGMVVGAIGWIIYSGAAGRMQTASDKANAMANDKISPADFPKQTTEKYLIDVADSYNAGLAPKAAPPPKDSGKKKKKKTTN